MSAHPISAPVAPFARTCAFLRFILLFLLFASQSALVWSSGIVILVSFFLHFCLTHFLNFPSHFVRQTHATRDLEEVQTTDLIGVKT
jgi:hypothetical protein